MPDDRLDLYAARAEKRGSSTDACFVKIMQSYSVRVALALSISSAMLLPGWASGHVARRASTFPTRRVTATVGQRLVLTHAVGIAVAVVEHGRVVYAHGFGARNRHSNTPVDVATRFEIGSDTKQFTAAAVLQLKEQGRLSLDDRLAKYVPNFPHADELTLRELLYQTTGLFNYVDTNHMVQITQTSTGSFEKIERMAAGPLHFTPGSRWEYSNTNYIALGRVIEIVSGESYDSYIRQHLFAPAEMDQTTTIDREQHVADMATGYWHGMRKTGPLIVAPEIGASWTWSAGEIVSTVGDLAKRGLPGS